MEQNQLISEHDKGWEHGCQMVIVDSLECMCLPFGLGGLWLRYAGNLGWEGV